MYEKIVSLYSVIINKSFIRGKNQRKNSEGLYNKLYLNI